MRDEDRLAVFHRVRDVLVEIAGEDCAHEDLLDRNQAVVYALAIQCVRQIWMARGVEPTPIMMAHAQEIAAGVIAFVEDEIDKFMAMD